VLRAIFHETSRALRFVEGWHDTLINSDFRHKVGKKLPIDK